MLKINRTFPFFHLVLSLLGSQSYLGCCFLEAKPFRFFFTWFCLSWVVSFIWAVVIWRQNLFYFYFLIYLYIFSSGSVSLGELVHFRLCVFILKQTNFENESQQSEIYLSWLYISFPLQIWFNVNHKKSWRKSQPIRTELIPYSECKVRWLTFW